ncbi:ATP-binding protein [Francisellaceae bacterium CB52]
MNNLQILDDSIFKIGEVLSVDGRRIKVKVDKSKNSSHIMYKGELLKNISVGSYVKIVKGYTKIIAKVDGEYIDEDKAFDTKEYTKQSQKINRNIIVSLIGFFDGIDFKRGIKELPLVFNECFLLNSNEFEQVHNFVSKDDEPLEIGSLSLEKGQSINVGINSLFASHIGIFGNTGSGKSYTLAKLYNLLFSKYQSNTNFNNNAKFILIDFNGEYSHKETIIGNKNIYNLSTKKETNNTDKIPLKEDDLLDIELVSILANATEKTQKPFIIRTLEFIKKVRKSDDGLVYFKNTLKSNIEKILKMADKEKAYMLVDYLTFIINKENNDSLIENLDWHNTLKYFFVRPNSSSGQISDNQIEDTGLYTNVDSYEFPNNVISKLIDFLYLQIVYDIYNNKSQNEHIAPAINKLKSKQKDIEKVFDTSTESSSIFCGNTNLTVINLNDTNIEMKKTIPMLIVKKLYEEQKDKYTSSNSTYLNIIIDEAHNILSHNSNRESETWKDYRLETFEEIIKEGRKFGVFLTLASQRPSDISSTIISQLHNYFLHRLINNRDIEAVEKTISYLDKVSFESLPILPTGSCIFAGLAGQIPVMIDIGVIMKENAPKSETIKLTEIWN